MPATAAQGRGWRGRECGRRSEGKGREADLNGCERGVEWAGKAAGQNDRPTPLRGVQQGEIMTCPPWTQRAPRTTVHHPDYGCHNFPTSPPPPQGPRTG